MSVDWFASASRSQNPDAARVQMKILLVSAPFILHDVAPAGIGALKGVLNANDHPADVLHLSLRLASTMGNEPYYYYAKNSWPAEFLYALCLFPHHPHRRRIEQYYKRWLKNETQDPIPEKFYDIDHAVQLLKRFHEREDPRFLSKKYDLVGFSITHNQLLASMYLAKHYKEKFPDAKMVFGGEQCIGDIGVSYLAAFEWIDYVVHGEGEETILDVIEHLRSPTSKPLSGCSYRREGRIVRALPRKPIANLDSLPLPDHSDYFEELERSGGTIPPVSIPMEMSRGCWWNKCSFCRHGSSHKGYRRFSPERIRRTMEQMSDRYQELKYVCADLIEYRPISVMTEQLIKSVKQFELFMELRATVGPEELQELKKAGLKYAQFGIESLSTSMLDRMSKGTTAIQNIQAVKLTSELGIDASFNLIIHFPGETRREFNETLANLKKCWHLFHSFNESGFSLEHASPMYLRPKEYGLVNLRPFKYYRALLPKEYYDRIDFLMWECDTKRPVQGSYREALERERWVGHPCPTLTYLDGGSFLEIVDDRYVNEKHEFRMDGLSREIYLFCHTIKTRAQIHERFGDRYSKKKIDKELNDLCGAAIMFGEGERYLSLATRC